MNNETWKDGAAKLIYLFCVGLLGIQQEVIAKSLNKSQTPESPFLPLSPFSSGHGFLLSRISPIFALQRRTLVMFFQKTGLGTP